MPNAQLFSRSVARVSRQFLRFFFFKPAAVPLVTCGVIQAGAQLAERVFYIR